MRAAFSSYRVQMLAGIAASITILAAVWLYVLYGPLTDALGHQQQAGLETAARLAAAALGETSDPNALQASTERFGRESSVRLTVIARDGTVLADSRADPASMENHASRPEVAQAMGGGVGVATRRSRTLGVDYLYVAVPASIGGAPVVIRAAESLARVRDSARAAHTAGVLLLALALATTLLAGWRLIRTFADPVERLARAAQAMAAGDLSAPLEPTRGALAPLADSLAFLRDQLRTRIAQLETERTRLQEVIDGLDDAVLLVESDVVVACNSAAARLFGASSGKPLAGRPTASLAGPETLRAAVREAVVSDSPADSVVGPTPLQQSFRVRSVPLHAHDARPAHLVIVSDITHSARLDAMRRDFVANASHELKTPATGILLLAESASAAARDGDVEQTLAFLQSIHEEAERLRSLVGDLLDLSRLEGTQFAAGPTDVRAAVDLALSAHRRAAEVKGLALQLDDSAVQGHDVYAACDPPDLAIALDNVLANAIAYTDQGSVTVLLARRDERVIIEVTDTGVGIPAEHLPRVFERFYRVDAARSRHSGGTGLGLSLVKHAMERCGGTASIASEVDRGTTVTLALPEA
ncbi:ATP-binding protein [Coriobacteriia bacterium Es71-Z0120]|uniref:sensor histidine kinase n=1 Tax=Parvivirga hydrogeniphila TaxID=2939460 RepID=UPI002260CEF3|nr:ATP-binding protein [Parvivirga hydrogeniphila]MCL4078609.1 ATP-binding protein [Parvivirga hydrogeniphila]